SGDLLAQMVGEPARKLKHRFLWHLFARERRGAFPADFDAREQVGLRAGELEQPFGAEVAIAEDLGVGHEADRSPSAVGRRAEMLQPALRMSALELLRVEFAVAGDLDAHVRAQRID